MADAPLYSERLIDALGVAARLHAGQRRKGSDIPYLSHLLGTCGIALDYGAGEEEAIAALLHDAIEDVQPTAEARAAVAAFGPEVLRIVEGCTDSDTHPKPPWRERKEAYVEHVAVLDGPILLVSAADKLHNSRVNRQRPAQLRRCDMGPLQGSPRRLAVVLPRARRRLPCEPSPPRSVGR